MSARVRITLRKSTVGTTRQARGTVRALGLHRIGQSVEHLDGPAVRGQIRAVRYLVEVQELAAAPATRSRTQASRAAKDEEAKP